jgi:hypothetical protein
MCDFQVFECVSGQSGLGRISKTIISSTLESHLTNILFSFALKYKIHKPQTLMMVI